jgi:dephospho-CoA kinase
MTTSGILSRILIIMSIQNSKSSLFPTKTITALTGGIASGKSYACNFLKARGNTIITLDEISSQLYTQDDIQQQLHQLFGTSDKTKIKHIVFNDKLKLTQLEEYLHPKILAIMQEEIVRATTNVVVEVPLLVEQKLYHYFDNAIVIVVQPEIQLKRIMQRDGISKELAYKILQHQATNSERKHIANYLPTVFIENNSTVAEFDAILYKQLELLH